MKSFVDCNLGALLDCENYFLDEEEEDATASGEGEDGCVEKRKLNPYLHAEFDHSHIQVARLVYDIVTIIDRGWVAALMWKGKAYEAAAHYLLSLTAPKGPNARCVKGLSDSFHKSAPVKHRHHACPNKYSKTGHPDSEYPAMINLFGFSEEMAAEWLAGKPPWLKAVDRPMKDRRRRPRPPERLER
jgi:hypothetical protein